MRKKGEDECAACLVGSEMWLRDRLGFRNSLISGLYRGFERPSLLYETRALHKKFFIFFFSLGSKAHHCHMRCERLVKKSLNFFFL